MIKKKRVDPPLLLPQFGVLTEREKNEKTNREKERRRGGGGVEERERKRKTGSILIAF